MSSSCVVFLGRSVVVVTPQLAYTSLSSRMRPEKGKPQGIEGGRLIYSTSSITFVFFFFFFFSDVVIFIPFLLLLLLKNQISLNKYKGAPWCEMPDDAACSHAMMMKVPPPSPAPHLLLLRFSSSSCFMYIITNELLLYPTSRNNNNNNIPPLQYIGWLELTLNFMGGYLFVLVVKKNDWTLHETCRLAYLPLAYPPS